MNEDQLKSIEMWRHIKSARLTGDAYKAEINEYNRMLELVDKLNSAKEAYYNTDKPIMSDDEFDMLEDELKELHPNNEYFNSVGIKKIKANEIYHTVPMLSSQKCKSITDIEKWFNKIKGVLYTENIMVIVEPKIDGLSATVKYDIDGNLKYVATRGDGVVGTNITHIANMIDDIPKTLFANAEIRGELYIPKDNKIYDSSVSLRNICSGLINRKDNLEDIKNVRFIAYKIVNDDNDECDCVTKLKSLEGLHSVYDYSVYCKFTIDNINELYNKYLTVNRDKFPFETDGLMIIVSNKVYQIQLNNTWKVSHHPHYTMALKPPPVSCITKVTDIKFNVSRFGYLIPVVHFEPIKIGPVNVTKATMSNYSNVIANNLSIGNTVEIVRSGDVIPYFKRNLSFDNNSMIITPPLNCSSCNERVAYDGVNLICDNPNCPEMNIAKLIHWCKVSVMDSIGESTLKLMYDNKIVKNVVDLYKLNKETLLSLPGLGEKKVNNITDEIEKSKNIDFKTILYRLGISGFGRSAMKLYNINNINDIKTMPSSAVKNKLLSYFNNEDNLKIINELAELLLRK